MSWKRLKAIYAEMPKGCVASVGLMRRVPFTQSIGVAGTREVRCKNWDALYDLCESGWPLHRPQAATASTTANNA